MQHQSTVIPPFDERGNLPSGIHKATFDEVAERFAGVKSSLKRKSLFKSLQLFYDFVKVYAKAVYLDGSFVSSKLSPNDIDIFVIFPSKVKNNNEVAQRFLTLQKDLKKHLHIFMCFETDFDKEAHWLNWFTLTRVDDKNRQFPKGIISLEFKND